MKQTVYTLLRCVRFFRRSFEALSDINVAEFVIPPVRFQQVGLHPNAVMDNLFFSKVTYC